MENTAVAPRGNQHRTIKDLLCSDQFKTQVAMALPKHCTPDRFVRVALTAMMRTPKLMGCSQESLFSCLLSLSQMGLEPDGRRAHLIPFEDRKRGTTVCTLIVDYKGLAELIMRSGEVSYLHADIVCENDEFDVDMGQIFHHRVDYRKPRGKAYAAYATAKMRDGTTKSEVMTRDEVESIRGRSRAGQSGPWVTDWNEMAKKTVFRRLSKWLPLSPELRDRIEADDELQPVGAITAPQIPVGDFMQIEAPAEPEADQSPNDDNVPMGDPQPETKPEVATKPEQLFVGHPVVKLMLDSKVDFDDFRSYLKTTGLHKDPDTIPDWELVPDAILNSLAAEGMKLANKVIRVFGKAGNERK
jgi:recombination protein RecT